MKQKLFDIKDVENLGPEANKVRRDTHMRNAIASEKMWKSWIRIEKEKREKNKYNRFQMLDFEEE